MDLRLQPWSYTSAARHWAGPLGSLLPSCEARAVWCPRARSCTWKESALIAQMIPYISPLKKRNWTTNKFFQLKPWKHFCNRWHLHVTIWYSKRVQLDHVSGFSCYVDPTSLQCSGGHWTAKSSCLAQVKGKGWWSRTLMHNDTMTMTQCQYRISARNWRKYSTNEYNFWPIDCNRQVLRTCKY